MKINKKYIPIIPTDKQFLFLALDCLEAFYGGAAGGGKSIALLIDALLYVHFSEYNAILIRDTMKNLNLPDSIMDVAFQWLMNTNAHWSGEKNRWIFPSGATLSFGYLDNPRDHYNFQSSQFQFIGIDEAVNIREKQALYMFSRLRKLEGCNIPIRFRCASNPPTSDQLVKGEWVKNRYVDTYTRNKDVIFIPARMDDNPYLNQDLYKKSLAQLDPITRKQLEEGDWEIRQKGRTFDRSWFELVDKAPTESRRVRYWDKAATKPSKVNKEPCFTSGSKLAVDKNNITYIESIIRFRKEPLYVEQTIRQTADVDGKSVKIYMEQEPGSSGKDTIDHYRRMVLPEFTFQGDKVTGSKFERAVPLSSQAEAGNIKIVKGYWNEEFLDELELFPDGKFKDQVDSTSGAFNKLSFNKEPKVRIIQQENKLSERGQCQNCNTITISNQNLYPVKINGEAKMVCILCREGFTSGN